MPARLQSFGHLRLLDEGGGDIAFPEKALLILCYLHARGLPDMSRADAALGNNKNTIEEARACAKNFAEVLAKIILGK